MHDPITPITRRVKQTLVQALGLDVNPDEIDDNEALFGEGLGADSIASLEIVFALEEEFGFEVDDEDLQVELFDSVRTLSQYIAEKLGEGPPAAVSSAAQS